MPQIPYRNYVFASIAFGVVTIILVVVASNWLPPLVPLFYGLPESEEQLVPTLGLSIPAIVSLVICGVNIAIAMFQEDEFLKKTLVASSLVATLFAVVTTLKIIWLIH